MKNQKGISLIALIITIIVIVILAAVVVTTSINTPKSANFAVFCSNVGEAQQSVSLAYADRYATEAAVNGGSITDTAAIYAKVASGSNTGATAEGASPLAGIAGGKLGNTNDPTKGIKGTSFYKITSTSVAALEALKDINTNDGSNVYVSNKGEVFVYPGFENTDGNVYITSSVYYVK